MKVKCPTCQKLVEYEGNEFRPFCSARCKMIDLGDWASEKYTIPVDKSENDFANDFPESESEDEQN